MKNFFMKEEKNPSSTILIVAVRTSNRLIHLIL